MCFPEDFTVAVQLRLVQRAVTRFSAGPTATLTGNFTLALLDDDSVSISIERQERGSTQAQGRTGEQGELRGRKEGRRKEGRKEERKKEGERELNTRTSSEVSYDSLPIPEQLQICRGLLG